MEKTIYELFDELNPYQKALFIDSRLAWASGGGLCAEVHKRICTPMTDEDPMTNDQSYGEADRLRL